jgi:hypothetical protein
MKPANPGLTSGLPRVMAGLYRAAASTTRRVVVARAPLATILKVQLAGQVSNFVARVRHMPESSPSDFAKQRDLIRRRIAFDRSELAVNDVVSGFADPGFY